MKELTHEETNELQRKKYNNRNLDRELNWILFKDRFSFIPKFFSVVFRCVGAVLETIIYILGCITLIGIVLEALNSLNK